jgi:hypothetical protein
MVELGEQRQPAVRRQRVRRLFQFESEHRLSYHYLTLSVKGFVVAHNSLYPLFMRPTRSFYASRTISISVLGCNY